MKQKYPCYAVPSQPTDPTVMTVRGSPFELSISWEPPHEPNGIMTYYTIYCQEKWSSEPNSSPEYNIAGARHETVRSEIRTVLFPGLRPYTVYDCFVSGNTTIGEGNFSSFVTARTDESSETSPVLKVSFTVHTNPCHNIKSKLIPPHNNWIQSSWELHKLHKNELKLSRSPLQKC